MAESLPIGDPRPDGDRVEARSGAATAEVLPYEGLVEAKLVETNDPHEEGEEDARRNEIENWVDEILAATLAERGCIFDDSERAFVKNAFLDPFVAERLQTKDDIASLIAFLIEVLEEKSARSSIVIPDAKYVFSAPKHQSQPSLMIRLKNSLHSGAEWTSDKIKPWIIFGIIRYRILTGPMQGGQPINYASHTRNTWRHVRRWLNPRRRPIILRFRREDLPKKFKPRKRKLAAPSPSPLIKPSMIPDFVDLVRLQVAHALSGKQIRVLNNRYPNVSPTVVHEVLRRDELRFGTLPDAICLGVAQMVRACSERNGQFFTRPFFQKDERKQIRAEGEKCPWKPEYTLFPERAPRVQPKPKFSPMRLVAPARSAPPGMRSAPPGTGSSLQRTDRPLRPTSYRGSYSIFESDSIDGTHPA